MQASNECPSLERYDRDNIGSRVWMVRVEGLSSHVSLAHASARVVALARVVGQQAPGRTRGPRSRTEAIGTMQGGGFRTAHCTLGEEFV